MASTLTVSRASVPVAPVGSASPLPLLHGTGVDEDRAGEDASLRANLRFGQPETLLPYHAQDGYGREVVDQPLPVAVLENDRLTATFLLGLGGRLWSLVDRQAGRELLYQPDRIQLGNLALRNAWFAGGVEWNMGATGHWGLTCSPVFAGRVEAPAGFPVLRMWEYERLRGLIWRLDCWLPDGSPVLYVRSVVENPHPRALPLYWWSNIAVASTDGMRVVVPAERASRFGYAGTLEHVDVPYDGTSDISSAGRIAEATDYYFDVVAEPHPWICAMDEDGRGLAQISTGQLPGRKLFVWGRGPGGANWQRWLGARRGRGYVELQAGLARTQLEHVPLAAGATVSWTEAYGPVHITASAARSSWNVLRADTATAVAALAEGGDLNAAHTDGQRWSAAAPSELLSSGSGWGALDVAAGALPHSAATPFPPDTLGPDQSAWRDLARAGRLPASEPPAPSILGPRWAALLEAAPEDWHRLLHIGRLRLAEGDRAGARRAWEASLAQRQTAWAERDLAALAALDGDVDEAARRLRSAHTLQPDCLELTLEALHALCVVAEFDGVRALVASLSEEQRGHGRVRYYECYAAVERGDPEALSRARELLEELVIPDLREGEQALTRLWQRYQDRAGSSEPIPERYDFRMRSDRQPAPTSGAQ